jgi:hypothetical protein
VGIKNKKVVMGIRASSQQSGRNKREEEEVKRDWRKTMALLKCFVVKKGREFGTEYGGTE